MPSIARHALPLIVCLAAALPLAHAQQQQSPPPPKEFSAAERALFMSDQFTTVKPPTTLRYAFRHAGSAEPAFDDKVSIALTPRPDTGRCCNAVGDFLSGEHKVDLPPVDGATGNPVTLFFLERDVREMQRLTTGKSAYFRKRIRMAIFEGAQQRAVDLRYQGRTVAGREFTITPYADDPNHARFESLVNKRYTFVLSDAVPGGVYAIRTTVADTAKGGDAPPLLSDDLWIEGADPASVRPATGT